MTLSFPTHRHELGFSPTAGIGLGGAEATCPPAWAQVPGAGQTDPDTANWFAKQFESGSVGGVVLETMALPEAIISAPGLDGPYSKNKNGECMYDESEYLVDGRQLRRVTVAHRY
jgi:hypothetical protein